MNRSDDVMFYYLVLAFFIFFVEVSGYGKYSSFRARP